MKRKGVLILLISISLVCAALLSFSACVFVYRECSPTGHAGGAFAQNGANEAWLTYFNSVSIKVDHSRIDAGLKNRGLNPDALDKVFYDQCKATFESYPKFRGVMIRDANDGGIFEKHPLNLEIDFSFSPLIQAGSVGDDAMTLLGYQFRRTELARKFVEGNFIPPVSDVEVASGSVRLDGVKDGNFELSLKLPMAGFYLLIPAENKETIETVFKNYIKVNCKYIAEDARPYADATHIYELEQSQKETKGSE